MRKRFIPVLLCLLLVTAHNAIAQSSRVNPDAVADTTVGIRPVLRIENVSPNGHCDNQELSFYAPWADHYEIYKRRTDTAWIKGSKPNAIWLSESLKPGTNGMIYKRLEEQGTYEFFVKAFKGVRYRSSDTLKRGPCAGPGIGY